MIPVVAKGLTRRKILAAKSVFLYGTWTALYWICFGITYGYNAYFWDNGIAENLFFAASCTWLYGVWLVAFHIFFSSVSKSSSQVLMGTGGAAAGVYLLAMFPKIDAVLPAKLMNGTELLYGAGSPDDYYAGIIAAGIMIMLCMALAAFCLDRKQL